MAERTDGHCASRPWQGGPELSGNVTGQCSPRPQKGHTQKDTKQKHQHSQQAQTRRDSLTLSQTVYNTALFYLGQFLLRPGAT